MKGIILAGGTGTRLFPLTKVTNKHLLPIGKEPMIYHSVKQLVSAGITSILVVTSTNHMGDVVNLLGSGKDFNCDLLLLYPPAEKLCKKLKSQRTIFTTPSILI